MPQIHRRTFLRNSAGIGLALTATRLQARSINEKLNVGFIGIGDRGKQLLKQFGTLPDVRVAALCDPDQQRLEEAGQKYPEAARYVDLRKLIEDRQIDAVAIATCNHWHALATIWACEAGKDVYVEKPLSHNHWEGEQVVRAARKYERIVQVGTQQRSDPLQDELKAFLHDERALGQIEYAVVCRFGARAPIGRRSAPLQPPAGLDYNLWLGPARERPIYRDKLHYDWHWDWNTGNGELGNWGVHVLDDALNVVLRDQVPFPKRIVAAGGRVAWDDAGDTPNVCLAYYDTGSVPILFAMSNLSGGSNGGSRPLRFRGTSTGYVIHCEGGYYEGGRGGGTARDLNGKLIRTFRGDSGAGHARNFVEAVASRDPKRLRCEVQIGHYSTAWCNLADAALRAGGEYAHSKFVSAGEPKKTWREIIDILAQQLHASSVRPSALRLSGALKFDSRQQRFVGDGADGANAFLKRDYREEFALPAIA